jgi:uncharacterized protein (DUF2164 family)
MIKPIHRIERKEKNVDIFKLRGVFDFIAGRMGKGYFKEQL